jgi:hypothetical protein
MIPIPVVAAVVAAAAPVSSDKTSNTAHYL